MTVISTRQLSLPSVDDGRIERTLNFGESRSGYRETLISASGEHHSLPQLTLSFRLCLSVVVVPLTTGIVAELLVLTSLPGAA
jgi:hypothetical protein